MSRASLIATSRAPRERRRGVVLNGRVIHAAGWSDLRRSRLGRNRTLTSAGDFVLDLRVARAGHSRLVASQGHQREVYAVEVVLQIEDLREPGAGEGPLVPASIRPLRSQQIGDASADGLAVGATGGDQSK